MILSVPLPIGLSVAAILNPERKVWAAAFGILVSIFDVLVFDKIQKDWKKEAAKIQERFDCEIFELEWNDFKVGDKPDPEKIHRASQHILRKEAKRNKFLNWHSPYVESLPLHLARIVCQRANIFWDSDLRRRYTAILTAITYILAVGAVVAGLGLKMNMETFVLSILAPISPTFLWAIREIRKQKDSATTLDLLMKYARQLWRDSIQQKLSPEEASYKSRVLQDELFFHRYSNQPIFNWIFKLLRKEQEAQMNVGAKELVSEALNAEQQ